MSSVNSFISSLSICKSLSFFCFDCLRFPLWCSIQMVCGNIQALFLILRKTYSFSPLRMLSVGLFWRCSLSNCPSTLLSIICHESVFDFVKCFFLCQLIVWYDFSFYLCVWCITLISECWTSLAHVNLIPFVCSVQLFWNITGFNLLIF